MLVAAAVMGSALWLGGRLADSFMDGRLIERIATLAVLCGGGAALYGLTALALGTYRLGEIKAMLRRKA